VDDEELKKIAPPTASSMEILQFVKNSDVDPLFFESSYYLAPEEKISKPYALFLAALTETKYYAIAKIAMHNREHVVIIRPAEGGLVLHTMYYSGELRRANKAETPKTKFSGKELDLAKSLIEHLAAPFKRAEFHDAYRENVEHLIEQKKNGKKTTAVTQPPRKAAVINLTEALKRSLKASARPKTTKSVKKKSSRRKAA
jgi:DNA end-binding protein Ku